MTASSDVRRLIMERTTKTKSKNKEWTRLKVDSINVKDSINIRVLMNLSCSCRDRLEPPSCRLQLCFSPSFL